MVPFQYTDILLVGIVIELLWNALQIPDCFQLETRLRVKLMYPITGMYNHTSMFVHRPWHTAAVWPSGRINLT